ncbi:MAG: D-alanine--D-alanine ligase family protein [Varibaculum sp.]|nr:D-alanine--D-alanine ligase family protein [Varibaculum sp.]
MAKKTVMLIFGGVSGEHGISCATAAGVLDAIDRDRYRVVPVGITRQGEWVLSDDDPEQYRLRPDGTAEISAIGVNVFLTPGSGVLGTDDGTELGHVDVAFPLLHGPFGEDGTIQGLLEMAGVRYVGCGVAASAAAMDKHLTKQLLSDAGLEVGSWRYLPAFRALQLLDNQNLLADFVSGLRYPLFVKPTRAGSSLGISMVEDLSQLPDAILQAQRHDPNVIIEGALSGVEVECAVLGPAIDGVSGRPLGDGKVRTTDPGCIEISGAKDFYDFDTKYLDPDAINLQIPARISDSARIRVREMAAAAFTALGCEGLSRVDFFVDGENVAINEVNTMPGFTPYSMFPALWANMGISYPDLVTELIEMAYSRPLGLR